MTLRKILIANRGEIASRVMRTAHALGIATVAVYADPDRDAPFVELADEAVRLPGFAPTDTYLRGDLIIAAAETSGADAIHPGYGFLSENAGFAQACAEAGLTFIGPSPEAIAAMGSKLKAKELMTAAGVPVLPGGRVPDDADPTELGTGVGFPLLVKAAFGGGGRGMRLVHQSDELAEAVTRARGEAASAFGDGTVFLERFVTDPRHVEVQILGDTHGNIVHLFERECSIQRRYQKIIEESPSPVVDEALRAELGAAAVAAGKAIGYVGAGTVEFVLDRTGAFYFLEVNTRLQVEHPVTELVTGLDLVELQLRIAEGEHLPAEVDDARIRGHAIEARLYAEHVPAGFLPATGVLHHFAVPELPGIRVDSGVTSASVITPHYDAMLAKVIAHGRTRGDAVRRLRRALVQATLHGVTTNRDLLTAILAEPDFIAGHTDTGYLGRHPTDQLVGAAERTAAHAVAAALAWQAGHRATASVLSTLPAGWRNVPSTPQRVSYLCGETELEVALYGDDAALHPTVNGEPLGTEVRVLSATRDRVDLEEDGARHRYRVHRVETSGHVEVYVDGPDGSTALTELPRFPEPRSEAQAGSLTASMPGVVVRVLAKPGATVTAGSALLVLEAMKMEHTVRAPTDGVLSELRVEPGQQIDQGQVLAVVSASSAKP